MRSFLVTFCLTIALALDAIAAGPFTENGGVVIFEAEDFSNNVARSSHAWTATNAVPGFSGESYVEATPHDGAVITNNIPATSPELQFAINFATTGQRFIWIRGNSPDANGAS